MIFFPEEYDAGALSPKHTWKTTQRPNMPFEIILNFKVGVSCKSF
jgi:hypothetical protein